MAFLEVNNVEIKGVATAVPKQIKVAKDMPYFTKVEAENFSKVTGVVSSHVAPADMTLSDLCQAAAEKILEYSVCPAMVDTGILSSGTISEEQLQADIKNYPLGRYGKPEDIAYSMIYLLSDASAWVTGTNLVIDGGISAK